MDESLPIMENALPDEGLTPNPRKKRIPRACAACRRSKVKCDEKRPCSRCKVFGRECVFAERPPDPYESLKDEIESLKARLHAQHQPSASSPGWSTGTADGASSQTQGRPASVGAVDTMSPSGPAGASMAASPASPGTATTVGFGALGLQDSSGQTPARATKRRKLSHYEVATLSAPDLVNAGVIPVQDAEAYFRAFFSGCHRFVPVFDPGHDTTDSVRRRSPLLFGSICSVGCRVLSGPDSHHCRLLGFHTQRMLNAAVLAPSPTRASTSSSGARCSLETIQALMVKACYASERSLLVAIAMRMAIDLGLPEAYDTLAARSASRRSRGGGRRGGGSTAGGAGEEEEAVLMRKTRTWLHIAVMSHIMHVDAGDLPTLRFRGAASRCRILLESRSATDEDLHLLPQVELNAIRARVRASLARLSSSGSSSRTGNSGDSSPDAACPGGDDEALMDVVRGARIDIDVWFGDWMRVLAPHLARLPWLAPNLAVQRFWSDAMAMCSAVRCLGLEDVSAMTPAQRAVLLMAKASLRDHLDVVLQEPRLYLANLRYAADFVWAKNAFCLLLLLKLDMLLPEGEDDDDGHDGEGYDGRIDGREALVAKSRALLAEFARSVGPTSGVGGGAGTATAKSNTGAMYLHLVRASIEKYSQALQSDAARGDGVQPTNAPPRLSTETAAARSRGSGGVATASVPDQALSGPSGAGAATSTAAAEGGHTDLESFVPDQFVFEWDFPGLTLFSSPTTEATWFDDFLTGALDGADDFYGGLGWGSVDFSA